MIRSESMNRNAARQVVWKRGVPDIQVQVHLGRPSE